MSGPYLLAPYLFRVPNANRLIGWVLGITALSQL